MLATTKTKQDAVEPVSVSEVVEAALALVKPQVRHRATITWTATEELYAAAHRTKLVQVMVNLVVNASQAFTDNRASANEIRLYARGEGNHVVIWVDDNGAGMDEETKLRVLEPFFTTKEPGQGTGLGLFPCNSIVESLGGRLAIDSELGKGSRITVCLPMAGQAPAASRTDRPAPPEAATTPRLRVLVVDDEPEIRRGLQRILGGKHDLVVSSNGVEALAGLVAGERYDVILCDLLMPEMTGIELFREIDLHFREQAERVVFLTRGRDQRELASVHRTTQRARREQAIPPGGDHGCGHGPRALAAALAHADPATRGRVERLSSPALGLPHRAAGRAALRGSRGCPRWHGCPTAAPSGAWPRSRARPKRARR